MSSIPSTEEKQSRWAALQKRARGAVMVIALLSLVAAPLLATAAMSGSVAAQDGNETNVSDKAPYYENETTDVGNESWTDGRENATADNIMHYATRLGSFVVGGDGSSSGPLLMGMIVLGGILGVTIGSGVGIVGGGVIAVAALFAVVAIDIAPAWFYAVGLFGIGILLAASIKRVLR